MAYLLDTNIISDLMRNPQSRVARHISGVGEAHVRTSIIVAAELRFGVIRRNSDRLTSRLEAVLSGLDIIPFEPPADVIYGEIRTGLERAGTLIGTNDLLIAAHAIALEDTLITANEAEFARVPRLRLENWLAAA